MPVIKLPVVHKFGIISHRQRLDLQERLLREAYAKAHENKLGFISTKNPNEVNEGFVQRYNRAVSRSHEVGGVLLLERVEDEAQRLLQRIRRRAGIRDAGRGNHVNAPLAWTELIIMAQCHSKVHQDCLDTLILSLEQAPCGEYQIPALFYVIETVLYWLQTESAFQTHLRSAEIKLLKVGELVAQKLYYHFLAGHLEEHTELRRQLTIYIEGFHSQGAIYEPYPNAEFSFLYIKHVGKLLMITDEKKSELESKRQTNTNYSMKKDIDDFIADIKLAHKLNPTLWHALDVWRCVNQSSGDLQYSLEALLNISSNFSSQDWLESCLAISVVADAAKSDEETLRTLLNIAHGHNYTKHQEDSTQIVQETSLQDSSPSNNSAAVTGSISVQCYLSDIHELSETGSHLADSSRIISAKNRLKAEDFSLHEKFSKRENYGTVNISTRSGLSTWNWELAVKYVQLMTQITLHGSVSTIRQNALRELSNLAFFQIVPTIKMAHHQQQSHDTQFAWRVRYTAVLGLFTITQACADAQDERECLRNVACRVLRKVQKDEREIGVLEALKVGQIDGHLQQLAQTSVRVSSSFLAGRIAAILCLLFLPPYVEKNGLQLAPLSQRHKQNSDQSNKKHVSLPRTVKQVNSKPQRTTMKQELDLATALQEPAPRFHQRRDLNLRRIVEDQWRKEQQFRLEASEQERQNVFDERVHAHEIQGK